MIYRWECFAFSFLKNALIKHVGLEKIFFSFRRHDLQKCAGLCGIDPFIRKSKLKKEVVPKPVGRFVCLHFWCNSTSTY